MTGAAVGAYYSHGDMRKFALELSIASSDELGTQSIVDRADAYFRFLVGDTANG